MPATRWAIRRGWRIRTARTARSPVTSRSPGKPLADAMVPGFYAQDQHGCARMVTALLVEHRPNAVSKHPRTRPRLSSIRTAGSRCGCRTARSSRTSCPTGGRVPFALTSGDQLRPKAPALYPHGLYRKQALEILHLSARLTDRQKVIASYCVGSGVPGAWGRGHGFTAQNSSGPLR
jgi:hypothetical protein